MLKSVARVVAKSLKMNAMGFESVDNFNHETPIEPFLVFTEFKMAQPIFGPHPHAGMSVMTYMLPESTGAFINRDSLGDHSRIEPGGAHVSQAGRGLQHDEVPEVSGVECHGFQIWINHADRDRLVPPAAFHARAADIPEQRASDRTVRVLLGAFEGLASPLPVVTPVTLLDVHLQPGAEIEMPAAEMAFIYIIGGKGASAGRALEAHQLVCYDAEGDRVSVSAAPNQHLRFLFASGTPHREPIVYGGPFVMTTQAQLDDTKRRYARGEMGQLSPLPSR